MQIIFSLIVHMMCIFLMTKLTAGPGDETHGLFGYIKNAFLN